MQRSRSEGDCKEDTNLAVNEQIDPQGTKSDAKMPTLHGTISDDYGWEVTVFHKLREATDGILFVDTKINWDRYHGDHSPRFEIHLVVWNYTLFEMNIYYLHHRD